MLPDWLKKLVPIFHRTKSETKPIATGSHTFFPRLASGVYFEFNWLLDCLVLFLWVGQSDYLSFCFTILKLQTGIKPVPLFHLISRKTKTSRQWCTLVFPRFSSLASPCLVICLVDWIFCALSDWQRFNFGFGYTTYNWKPAQWIIHQTTMIAYLHPAAI